MQDNANDFREHGAQIVVGTPGRIIDVQKRCTYFNLSRLEVLVLDEADMLLDMGFRESINIILSALPKQRRTGLFSATQTKEVKDLARAGLRNPVTLSVRVSRAADGGANGAKKNEMVGQAAKASQSMATPSTLLSVLSCYLCYMLMAF